MTAIPAAGNDDTAQTQAQLFLVTIRLPEILTAEQCWHQREHVTVCPAALNPAPLWWQTPSMGPAALMVSASILWPVAILC